MYYDCIILYTYIRMVSGLRGSCLLDMTPINSMRKERRPNAAGLKSRETNPMSLGTLVHSTGYGYFESGYNVGPPQL